MRQDRSNGNDRIKPNTSNPRPSTEDYSREDKRHRINEVADTLAAPIRPARRDGDGGNNNGR